MTATDRPAPEAAPTREGGARPRLGRNVIAIAAVSFFTDVSSEMIYPLLPVFLSTVLGGSASFIGGIEGAAESTAALLKLASGWWSDRVTRRKPLVVAGYTIAAIARPLVAAATSAWQVLGIRLTDRVGKGIRTSPRDALIADSVDPSVRGRAFGFHRAADHAGAVVGPLIAFAVLRWGGASLLRPVFWLAAIPGIIGVVVLLAFVREGSAPGRGALPRLHDTPAPPDEHKSSAASRTAAARGARIAATTPVARAGGAPADDVSTPGTRGAGAPREAATAAAGPTPLGGRFWGFLAVVLLFTLGNSTDAFLILRANDLGVPVALIPILWAMLHVVKSASSVPGGTLSDAIGRKPLIVAGWLLFATVYFAFGRATAAWQAWALFAVYGLFFGLTEGTEKALVADLVPVERRGTAFGWYNLAIGLGALPASLIFGAIWDRRGPAAAFSFGAALALMSTVGIAIVAPPGRRATSASEA